MRKRENPFAFEINIAKCVLKPASFFFSAEQRKKHTIVFLNLAIRTVGKMDIVQRLNDNFKPRIKWDSNIFW